MTYQETLNYLFTATPMFQQVGAAAYKPGLETTQKLDEYFNHPHLNYPTIHIAGTNGKGSCCHTLASTLQAAGYHVGLFTSPHLVDFRERIRVDGQTMEEAYVIDFVAKHRDYFAPLHPSFFELTTLMALCYFRDKKVDVAVIEVGLGGRLDSTNIIRPILSVITNISLEHTQYLGDTLAKIAAEKAGIIKENIPVVIGETLPETKEVFQKKAKQTHSEIYFAENIPEVIDFQYQEQTNSIRYTTKHYGSIDGELIGNYQAKNTNTILTAIHLLQEKKYFEIPEAAIKKGWKTVIESTGLRGRWEILSNSPLTICDTGHNSGGWKYLSQQLNKLAEKHTLHLIFGVAADKDITSILQLLPRNAHFYWTQALVKRAKDVKELSLKAEEIGLHGKMFTTVAEAYQAAQKAAQQQDAIFIGGSSFVVADLLTYLSQNN